MSINDLKSKNIGNSIGLAYLSDITGGGGGVTVVNAGVGITITGAQDTPMINNAGVIQLTAGSDISITGTPQNPTINYTGAPGGGVASVGAGNAISITGTPSNPIVNYIGGVGGGVATLTAGTNMNLTGTPANPIVNLNNNVEVPDGGYIGIGGAVLPSPVPMVNCLRMYKNPARSLWSAFLTAPNPPPPLVGGDALCLVNESKDFDALSVGNLKVFNQGDDYDVVNPFLHLGAVAGSQFAIAYNDPSVPAETIFMDTNTAPPVSFNLYNIARVNGASYFIPTLAQFYSTQTQPAAPVAPNTPIPLTYDGTFVSVNGIAYDGTTPSIIRISDAGTYKIISSVQFDSLAGGANLTNVWLQVDGTPVRYSNTAITIANNDENAITVEWFYTFNAGQYFEIYFSSVSGQTQATYYGLTPGQPQPETPSIITSVQRIA